MTARARPRRTARPWAAALLMLATSAGVAASKAKPAEPPPELPAETLVGSTLEGATSERVYVGDVAISHIVDGRLRVFDARAGKLLGMINTGYAGNFALSEKADEVYVATTYLSRGGRGERSDILEVWDTQTLAFKYEVLLPPKRAQTLNYRGLVRPTGNGRFVLVQNATPATSLTVVDLAERKVSTEVPTPGCWGVLPAASHPSRFAMLCGDGKLATVTLDDKGQVADRQVSEKVFDADNDAWFHSAEQIGDRYWFASFKGTLTEVDVSGAVAQVKGARSIVNAAQQKQGWRPGGYQAFAVHPSGRWAVVSMHDKGREGSHKTPAKQLWVVDLESGKRLATAPGQGSASLTFSRSGKRLQALDGMTGALRVWDWNDSGRLKPVATVKAAGEAALQLESHD
ncbi:MAG: amine dehydrogenase [Piscinibacter sp.]|uniref:amine dehydrogenase large subunit n=1 Tax=Piscinibacter sp. TaxID=1903157 RepID=UPI00258517EE|nr:amine dehydrogenase large subunit [Piscinibacter sp.]MCW5663093.1 amine dehydrogenase [Piscinibacter sp.]